MRTQIQYGLRDSDGLTIPYTSRHQALLHTWQGDTLVSREITYGAWKVEEDGATRD